jgi:hypothetical protein
MSLKITNLLGQDLGYIPITKNCASAIQDLMPIGVRCLWIDAVCINQADFSEKRLQVPLMGQIYSQAALVVGHLYTDNVFPIGVFIRNMVQAVANGKKFDATQLALTPFTRTLEELFGHQYFTRAWIVQEMTLAKSLILLYGIDCLYLDHLTAISHARSKGLISNRIPPLAKDDVYTLAWQQWLQFNNTLAFFEEYTSIVERLRPCVEQEGNSQRLTVAQIADRFVALGAKNPRDRVYATLSLASDSAIPELQPYYSLDISNKEIFTKISWHYLKEGKHLNLFLSAGVALRYITKSYAHVGSPGCPNPTHGPGSLRLSGTGQLV